MKSIADQLPPEIARQIHPDRRKNEAAYWAVRDQLLDQYRGQWVGFADGRVIASGSSPVTVFQAAEASGLHPFFICVGREEEPCRIRRTTFPMPPQHKYKEQAMAQSMLFAEVVDAVDQLSPEEQETLVALIRRRLAAKGRQRVIAEVGESRQEFDQGRCRTGTPDDLMKEILS